LFIGKENRDEQGLFGGESIVVIPKKVLSRKVEEKTYSVRIFS